MVTMVFARMGSRRFAVAVPMAGRDRLLGPVMVASQHFFEAGAELRHSY